MAEPGDRFRQNGIGNRLAVGDDAVEVKNQRAHYFNSCKRFRVRAFNMRLGRKGLAQPKTVEHFPLLCVSLAPRFAVQRRPAPSSLLLGKLALSLAKQIGLAVDPDRALWPGGK